MEEQIQPILNSPIIETAEKKSSKKILIISFIVLLFLIPLGLFGSKYLGNSNKKSEIVVNQKITPSFIPSATVLDNSTSQLEIEKDAKAIDDGLTNLDSSLNNIDQGLNDTQTNLE